MTATSSASPAPEKPVPPLLYPALLIAGICVIIASLLGIAAMSGWLPQARPQSAVVGPEGGNSAAAAGAKALPEHAAASRATVDQAGKPGTGTVSRQ